MKLTSILECPTRVVRFAFLVTASLFAVASPAASQDYSAPAADRATPNVKPTAKKDLAWSCATSEQAVRTIRLCTPKIRDPNTSDKRRVRYLMKRARAWVVEEEFWAAINDYSQVIDLNLKKNKVLKALHERAKLYNQVGEYQSAADDYTRLIEADSKDVSAFCKRGLANLNLKQHTAAIKDYTTALEIDAKNVQCMVGRGDVYEDLGNHEQAFKEYTAAIETNERYWDAYYQRAELYRKRGEKQLAIADYSRVLFLNSINLHVRQQLRDLGVREPWP